MCPHRLVVRTSRCGRDNPGSTPGVDIFYLGRSGAYPRQVARADILAYLRQAAREDILTRPLRMISSPGRSPSRLANSCTNAFSMTCLSPVHAWMAPATSMTQLLNTIIQKAQHTWSTCALKSHFAEPQRFDHGTQFYCMSACSVAASYKPPMLVTRVRLPACALLAIDGVMCIVVNKIAVAMVMMLFRTLPGPG